MKHRDYVKRLVKLGYGDKKWIAVERFYCPQCKLYRRKLPDFVVPFKQYSKDVIEEAKDCKDDLGYENYPCDMTIKRWRS